MKIITKGIVTVVMLVFSITLMAQTTTTIDQLQKLFVQPTVEWSVSPEPGHTVPMTWKEQRNSFSAEGYLTYNGFYEGKLIGTLTISPRGNVTGTLMLDRNYTIKAQDSRIVFVPVTPNSSNCMQDKAVRTRATGDIEINQYEGIPLSDGYFRDYRLAVMFSQTDFHSKLFGGSMDKVNAYLASLETFLNNIYVRELGIHFTMVRNKNLIVNKYRHVHVGLATSTNIIDDLIGNENYDVGVAFGYPGDGENLYPSRANLGAVQWKNLKGAVTVYDQDMWTVAHELGHFFGGNHTFETGAEPYPGQSILGYGHYYKFLSMANLQEMYYCIRNGDYLRENKGRQFKYMAVNHPPKIDRERMQAEYIVPKQTFFTIPVYASDPDGDSLWYGRQKEGYAPYHPKMFPNYEPSKNNVLSFGRTYNEGNKYETPGSSNIPVGEHIISIYVNDLYNVEEAIKQHRAPLYDVYKVKVKVVEGTPFKFTNQFQKKYQAGSKLALTWGVDPVVFKTPGKVRILFSEDGGKTFPHVLLPEAENDGACEVVLPNKQIDSVETTPNLYHMGPAVIRIETTDGRFFDMSNNDPQNGGMVLTPSNVIFKNAPAESVLIIDNNDPLPAVPHVTAETTDGKSVDVVFTQTQDANGLITRMWKANVENAPVYTAQYIQRKITTGIHSPSTTTARIHDSYIYNLQGQRISKPAGKGIYIKNGKKWIFR